MTRQRILWNMAHALAPEWAPRNRRGRTFPVRHARMQRAATNVMDSCSMHDYQLLYDDGVHCACDAAEKNERMPRPRRATNPPACVVKDERNLALLTLSLFRSCDGSLGRVVSEEYDVYVHACSERAAVKWVGSRAKMKQRDETFGA